MKRVIAFFFISFILVLEGQAQVGTMPTIQIAKGGEYFKTSDGKPFFWLGDTGWLLFVKLNRAEVIQFLDTRKAQGFNLIQIMLIHDVKHAVNRYGDSALRANDISKPLVTPGSNPENAVEYDFWDHVDFVVKEAAKRKIYLGLVPVWGTNVKNGSVDRIQAAAYAHFLALRFAREPNIVWLNGGDINGSDSLAVWNTIGSTLKSKDPGHLVTFHPRGRTTSSRWFHKESWLDFNMFQSGHRNYTQDTSRGETHYGEDNWKYVNEDLSLLPLKPTLDGEPSYEGIPQGLHDTTQVYWKAADVRRYAYWSLLQGAAGYTYGHNAIMQFYRAEDKESAYGAKMFWAPAMKEEGARQMVYVRKLFEPLVKNGWEADSSFLIKNGKGYERLAAARSKGTLIIYAYSGSAIEIRLGTLPGTRVRGKWYDPRNGATHSIGEMANSGNRKFVPPGKQGQDWILIVETLSR